MKTVVALLCSLFIALAIAGAVHTIEKWGRAVGSHIHAATH